ncbi:hypothetical protein AYO20_03516 [Fonsecaea nubica]|uniref:DUF2293 domain-containing protein n=1 Tax=Fonsecaea nubica TaxID=856822 RepID=A0A178D530_9EURO|nr:hypothetical protein AYO20_03516 [Fonsecaea nubica]OAL37340.1 hypothetical protein AYO20_03516 [Fonsecaea nubica]
MARVKQKVAKKGAAGASTRGSQVAKQKRHKVAIGGDPQEKKLPTVVRAEKFRRGHIASAYNRDKISFQERPPPGYTFIPAGNPELTSALKEFARRGDHKIYAVTVTPHAARHELSREVHRVGFHFPTRVVDQVCAHYGIRLNNEGKVVDESNDESFFSKVYRNTDGQRPVEEKDQITINTDAKQTIKDLFPNIPNNDLYQIIKTAFQLGDHRVGTANELPLVRRAQLSVVAHIRHNYTQYDKLLRQMPYNEARHMVEKETLVKLVEWRGGEDTTLENTTGGADDLLKEVIVISDEEASESDSDSVEPLDQDRVQVEELPSTSYGPGPGRAISPLPQSQPERILDYPPAVRSYRPSNAEIARRNQSRYAIWEQAKRDYHSNVAQGPVAVLERIYEPEPAPAPRMLVPLDPPTHSPAQVFHTQAPPASIARADYEPPIRSRQPSPPTYIRDANGVLYERIDTKSRANHADTPQHFHKYPAPTMAGAQVRTRPSSPQDFTRRESRNIDFERGDEESLLAGLLTVTICLLSQWLPILKSARLIMVSIDQAHVSNREFLPGKLLMLIVTPFTMLMILLMLLYVCMNPYMPLMSFARRPRCSAIIIRKTTRFLATMSLSRSDPLGIWENDHCFRLVKSMSLLASLAHMTAGLLGSQRGLSVNNMCNLSCKSLVYGTFTLMDRMVVNLYNLYLHSVYPSMIG